MSVTRELFVEQLPLVILTFGVGIAAAYWQHGFLPGGEVPFPLAGVSVPIWHLVWMGFWTGYTMAVVGEAAGIFALPYQMSILQFSSISVTPTTQLLTFLNPVGALLGFHRTRQTNWHFALWVCAGGAVGALIGPFVRLNLLFDPKPFTVVVGFALALTGIHLCVTGLRGFGTKDAFETKFADAALRERKAGRSPSGLPQGIPIETVRKGGGQLTISYWGETWTMSTRILFVIGLCVAIISSALGVGGGFLLVPIFAIFYRLPIYVLVAASIPYVISLSAVSIVTYSVIIPYFSGVWAAPEWAWGLFAASGGILGAWFAAKTQRFVPQPLLKLMLGAITAAAGALYIVSGFVELPFRL
ncbi:MAG: sulfite exporter TauE/SafE family protein [Xanthobacteraceae bacterium]